MLSPQNKGHTRMKQPADDSYHQTRPYLDHMLQENFRRIHRTREAGNIQMCCVAFALHVTLQRNTSADASAASAATAASAEASASADGHPSPVVLSVVSGHCSTRSTLIEKTQQHNKRVNYVHI